MKSENNSDQLQEALRLHKLGFGIHWLRPHSKIPVKSGWTNGGRLSPSSLKNEFRTGMNIGVRLGKASKLRSGGFLAIIDCDVKSSAPKHLQEMTAKLNELFPDYKKAPCVKSGRGNGSAHYYLQTSEPTAPYRASQSSEKVPVHMPGISPSANDKVSLSKKQIEKGLRLRAAWEISVMGEGQQVVLPPSIHPDTGITYQWVRPLKDDAEIPTLGLKGSSKKIEKATIDDFEFETIDLKKSTLPLELIDGIIDGDGVEDRSAFLFKVAIAMFREGWGDKQILSVLTDKNLYIGKTAFDHCKTQSRKKAAQWISDYTLSKVKIEHSAANAFDDLAVVDGKDSDWKRSLDRNRYERPHPSFKNIKLILGKTVNEPLLARNEFSMEDIWLTDTPWNTKAGMPITDCDSIQIKDWLAHKWRIEPNKDKIEEVLQQFAMENSFHPVRKYLKALEWDKTKRINSWLKTYLKANGPERYLQAVGQKLLCAMVKRIFVPGCKFDQVVILEGLQGVGKSTTVRILADPWFSDSHLNIGDKDAVMNMQGIWVYELGELSAMRRAETNTLKEFITRSTDRIRPPYGKRTISFPRQSVFIGTTNSKEYLKDPSGNRRFWPVEVGRIDLKALQKDRDQLLAEAVVYSKMESLWIEDESIQELERHEQYLRVEHDELKDLIQEFLEDSNNLFPKQFKISDLLERVPFTSMRHDIGLERRIHASLRALGYDNREKWDKALCRNVRRWRKLKPLR